MITLKLQLGEEVRRVGRPPTRISDIRLKAQELFGIEEASFKYKDEDGDILTIQTQEEYEDILKQHVGPFKLEVVDYQLLLLKRSSYLTGASRESFELDSFNDFCKSQPISYWRSSSIGSQKMLEKSPEIPKKTVDIQPMFESIAIQTDQSKKADIGINSAVMSDNGNDAPKFSDGSSQSLAPEKDEYNDIRVLFRELLNNYAAKYLESENLDTLKCTICGNLISGVIFSCGVCVSFYICSSCENTGQHPHSLLKQRNTQQKLKPIPLPVEPSSPDFIVKKKSSAINSSAESSAAMSSPAKISAVNTPEVIKEIPKLQHQNSKKADIKELLTKLHSMGFTDTQSSISALIDFDYNLEQVVEHLLAKQ